MKGQLYNDYRPHWIIKNMAEWHNAFPQHQRLLESGRWLWKIPHDKTYFIYHKNTGWEDDKFMLAAFRLFTLFAQFFVYRFIHLVLIRCRVFYCWFTYLKNCQPLADYGITCNRASNTTCLLFALFWLQMSTWNSQLIQYKHSCRLLWIWKPAAHTTRPCLRVNNYWIITQKLKKNQSRSWRQNWKRRDMILKFFYSCTRKR